MLFTLKSNRTRNTKICIIKKRKRVIKGLQKIMVNKKYFFYFCFVLIPSHPTPSKKMLVNMLRGVSLLYSFFHSSITIFFAKIERKGIHPSLSLSLSLSLTHIHTHTHTYTRSQREGEKERDKRKIN